MLLNISGIEIDYTGKKDNTFSYTKGKPTADSGHDISIRDMVNPGTNKRYEKVGKVTVSKTGDIEAVITADIVDTHNDLFLEDSLTSDLGDGLTRPMFYMHEYQDNNNLLGYWYSFIKDKVDGHNVIVAKGKINMKKPLAKQIINDIEFGSIRGASAAGQILKVYWKEILDGSRVVMVIRVIELATVEEISLTAVNFQANQLAVIVFSKNKVEDKPVNQETFYSKISKGLTEEPTK